MKANIIRLISGVLLLVSSLILFNVHLDLHYGFQAKQLFCHTDAFGGAFDCEAVSLSAFSSLFRIPLPAYGLGSSFWLLCLTLLAWRYRDYFKLKRWLVLSSGAMTLGAAIYLLISLLILKKLCPMCLVFDVALFTFFLVTWVEYKKCKGEEGAKMIDPEQEHSIKRQAALSMALSGLVFLVVPTADSLKSHAAAKQSGDVAKQWLTQEVVAVPEDAADPMIGPAQARVKVAVFSDFECPYCSAAAVQLERLLLKHPKDVHVRFKHFPLSNDCNPSIQRSMHVGACRKAAASQCAHTLGAFKLFHDHFFKDLKASPTDELIRDLSKKAKIDAEKVLACTTSESAKQTIRLHVAEGEALKIRGTPTLFINGRRFEFAPTLVNLEAIVKAITSQQ